MCAKSLQLCPTLCDCMDSSLPGSSVHGIHQVRLLKWVAVPCSRGSSQPRDGTLGLLCLLHWQAGSLPPVPPGKPWCQCFQITLSLGFPWPSYAEYAECTYSKVIRQCCLQGPLSSCCEGCLPLHDMVPDSEIPLTFSFNFFFPFFIASCHLYMFTVGLPHPNFQIYCCWSDVGLHFIILDILLIPKSFTWHLALLKAQGKSLKAKQVLKQLT